MTEDREQTLQQNNDSEGREPGKYRYGKEKEEKGTYLPVIAASGAALFIFGFVLFYPLAILGALILAATAIKWFKDDYNNKYAQTREPERETWPYNKVSKEKTGMWVFLMSEILLFGILISGYVYVRLGSTTWPAAAETHNVVIGAVNTIVLLASSVAMVLAIQSARENDQTGIRAGLLSVFALGATFLMIKLAIEWPREMANGFLITGGLAPSSYYTLMGAHAVHVGIGLGGITYLMAKGFAGKFTAQSHTALELIGLYWAFVDIIWIFLFPLFYLL